MAAPLRIEQFPTQVHWDLLCVHDPRHACTVQGSVLHLRITVQLLKETSVT